MQDTQPKIIENSSAWKKADLENSDDWHYGLTPEMLADIDMAAANFTDKSYELSEIAPNDFPLPSMRDIFGKINHELGSGKGFSLISGLPIEKYSPDQAQLIFYGIGTHLGVGVSQSHLGDYIGDVIDRQDAKDLRPYHNGGEFIMHRDPVDAVGLLCIHQAKSGGESRIISAATVHNIFAAEAPELLAPLYEGFHYWRLPADMGDTDQRSPYKIPVFKIPEGGSFSSHFIPGPIERALADEKVTPDQPQAKAIALLKELLWTRPELYYDMTLKPGDMQFVNNRLLLHGRTDYLEHDDISQRRHLLRLWLQMPSWGLPALNQTFYTNIDRAGGGVAAAHK